MKALALVLAAAAAAGCAAGPRPYLKAGYVPPASVAVLPFSNQTLSLEGPGAVRFWLDRRLTELKGYRTLPLEAVDERLRGLGLSEGGQLGAASPRELGAALGAEALLYGELLEFDYKTTGFLNTRKVRARFTLLDARSGEKLWEAEGAGAESDGALSAGAALKAGAAKLGEQWMEKAAASPLRSEILDAVWNAIEDLPAAR